MSSSDEGPSPSAVVGGLSQIMVEMSRPGLSDEIRGYLKQKGLTVGEESSSVDAKGRQWLVLSVRLDDVSQLVLELLARGLGDNIQGINAKTR